MPCTGPRPTSTWPPSPTAATTGAGDQVCQRNRDTGEDLGGFVVTDENGEQRDVVYFYRGPNPYYSERTVTLFKGNFARGTLGSVRALTDPGSVTEMRSSLANRSPGAQNSRS